MGVMLTTFKSESFPLTIVDCLFAGKPYIASDVGDIRNMLTTSNGVAGEVIELEDWEVPIERAAQVVAAFATDKQKYVNALSLVQDVANRYHIDAVASQYIRLFASSRVSYKGTAGLAPVASGKANTARSRTAWEAGDPDVERTVPPPASLRDPAACRPGHQ
jgi:hypothetical protein